MYNVIVFSTIENCWKDYTVTDTENRFNGYVPRGIQFYSKDEDGYYAPVKRTEEYKICKCASKPSIYKRRCWCCKKDEYKYAFTERTTKTTVTDKDVYYNEDRDRFISKGRISTKTRTEYGMPGRIIF